jgi:hypothetical protein
MEKYQWYEALGNILAETMLQNYTNEAYVRNNVALDDVSSTYCCMDSTRVEKYIASWVGIEYSDGASGLYAPCRAMRICPFKRIDTRILTPDNIEKG